jgi:hypothetical protein
MFHRHPLENPSLAPYGLATPIFQRRLQYQSTDAYWVNPEKLIAKAWDQRNRASAQEPRPVCTIVHEVLPGLAQSNRIRKGDFVFIDGMPYLTRDIVVLSTVVQWFGTNCGRVFLEDPLFGGVSHPEREFTEKLAKCHYCRDMPAFWCHQCNPQCGAGLLTFNQECHRRFTDASIRDRAVIDGLMRWLGREAGREFVADYLARKKRAQAAAHDRWWKDTRAKQAA